MNVTLPLQEVQVLVVTVIEITLILMKRLFHSNCLNNDDDIESNNISSTTVDYDCYCWEEQNNN